MGHPIDPTGSPWPAPPASGVASAAGPGLAGSPTPGRRRAGWLLIAAGILAIVATAVLGWRAIVGPAERFTAPGQVSIACDAGDVWRIGPRTSSSRTVGPVTVTTESGDRVPARVTVTDSHGDEVPLESMRGSETLSINGASYRAMVSFRCPSDDAVVVSVTTERPLEVAVFPSFWRTVRTMLLLLPIGLAGLAAIVVGIVFLVRRQRTGVAGTVSP